MSINDTSGGYIFVGLADGELEAFKKKWMELFPDIPMSFTNIAVTREDNEPLEAQSTSPGEAG